MEPVTAPIPPQQPRRRRIPRAAVVIVIVVALLAVLAVAAVAVGKRLAAQNTDAKAEVRTATIERTSLAAGMVLTGTLGYGDPRDLGGAGGVVTKLPEAGAIVEAGSVLMEVDGRPVFVGTGPMPLWREIKPGLVGPDVAALRAALAALGIDAGTPGNATYDNALSVGIAELYSRGGYEPPAALAAGGEEYQTAADAVKNAERSYADAQLALTAAKKQGPGKVDLLAANNSVEAAERALAAARAGDSGEALTNAREALDLAKAQRTEMLAPKDTSAEQTAWTEALAQLARAQGDLAAVPADDPDAKRAAEDALAAAGSAVTVTKAALDQASRGPSDAEKLQLESAVNQAQRAFDAAERGDMGAAVREAKEGLKLARAQRQALKEPTDVSSAELAVTSAHEDLATARKTLAEAGLNTVGPRDVLIVPAQTIRVDQVKAKLGLPADGAIISWTETVLYGRVDLTEAQRSRVSAGTPVTVTLPSGAELTAVVGDISNTSTNPETFEMIPARARIDIEDQSALADIGLATITVSLIENKAEDTLVVPVTALMALAEGGYCVELEDGTLVGVEVGLVADTRAEVRSPNLSEGQKVVIP
ncbi:MAG: hypothetical protein LBK59_00035 [Bifidobacteriaceae bacterium]|nr:hypothetical protein [Bifidobacteriaceae bacterium]